MWTQTGVCAACAHVLQSYRCQWNSALCGLTETKALQCDTLKARLMRTMHNLKARTVAVHLLLFKSHCLVQHIPVPPVATFFLCCLFEIFLLPRSCFPPQSQRYACSLLQLKLSAVSGSLLPLYLKKNALTSFIITTALQVLQSSRQLLHVFFTL